MNNIDKLVEKMRAEAKSRPPKEYKCQVCRDQGYYNDENGYLTRCQCETERIAAERLKRQGFKAGEMTLNKFSVDDEISLKMKAAAGRYLKEYPNAGSLAVMGQVGAGKTHLIVGLAQELMNAGHDVVYMPFVDMMIQLRQTIFNADEYGRIMSGLKHCGLLVIDDFLKGNQLPNDLSIVFELINYRYLNKKPIVVSSEKLISEITDIDEALGSRILEMTRGNRVQIMKDDKKNRRLIE